jgi:predicted amidohydrolase YtcJ
VYGESQKTDRVEALLCYTRYAAYATFDEDTLGSLETGKSADFLVLNKDYFTCPEHEIKDLSPVMTVVDGKIAAQALR